VGETAAYIDGLHWAFGLCAAVAVVMVGLIATLPARVEAVEPEVVSVHV
jgi:hypothetical protein